MHVWQNYLLIKVNIYRAFKTNPFLEDIVQGLQQTPSLPFRLCNTFLDWLTFESLFSATTYNQILDLIRMTLNNIFVLNTYYLLIYP